MEKVTPRTPRTLIFSVLPPPTTASCRRMKRNPHVLDARVCRAVLWWSILGEAMEAAKEAERRRAKRRESRRLVVVLAVSQRRGKSDSCINTSSTGSTSSSSSASSTSSASTQRGLGGVSNDTHYQPQQQRPAEAPLSGLPRLSSRTWSLPPLTTTAAAAAPFHGGGGGGRGHLPGAPGGGGGCVHGGSGGGRALCHGGAAAVARGYQAVHLDEAAVLSKVYEFL